MRADLVSLVTTSSAPQVAIQKQFAPVRAWCVALRPVCDRFSGEGWSVDAWAAPNCRRLRVRARPLCERRGWDSNPRGGLTRPRDFQSRTLSRSVTSPGGTKLRVKGVDLAAYVREIPDFPREGISYKDITPLLADPAASAEAVRLLVEHARGHDPELVVGVEARGLILGGALAHELGVGFVPARKAGKLPAETVRSSSSPEWYAS